MRVLVTGADGFIGSNVSAALANAGDEVFYGVRAIPEKADPKHYRQIDLLNEDDIREVVADIKPDVIVNCAGIIDSTQNVDNNRVFTQNLIEGAVTSGQKVGRLIICGSASVYGQVGESDLPVSENTPLRAASPYALSKKAEEDIAISLGEKYQLPVTIARIFNPIGRNMGPRFLVSAILNQIHEFKHGERTHIEINRLDSERDYVAVEDVAQAIRAIIHGQPKESAYNIGSGRGTSNGRLIELILDSHEFDPRPPVRQLKDEPEPLVASQADITKTFEHFGWQPEKSLEETIKEVVDERKRAQ